MLFTGLGRSVLGETVPSVESRQLGLKTGKLLAGNARKVAFGKSDGFVRNERHLKTQK